MTQHTEIRKTEDTEKAGALIGQSVPRIDGQIKVTGAAKYITDLKRPGMLYGKILFSDRPHAKILGIDATKALELEGVKAVITAGDAPSILYGLYLFDHQIFARGRVRHIGEPVAAVAAVSKKAAEEALKLIVVEYEDLPAVFSWKEAIKPDAPILHPDVESYKGIYPYIKYGNVAMDARVSRGDIQRGFAEADFIFENTYKTSPMHQASIEPHACLAEWDSDGRVTIWTGTQQLSVCHSEVSKSLGLPQTKVRIIPAWLGAGFGGKLKSMHEQIAALLAKAAHAPVKLEMTREEEFTASHPRAGFEIHMKTGVKKDGRIVAKEVDVVSDVGAYSDHALGMVTHAITYSPGPYSVPNCSSRGRAIYTNNPDWGCMRGYGATEIAFATESQMDLIARALKIDPAELRRMNLVQEGEVYLTTQTMHNVHVADTMDQALEASGYYEKKGRLGPNRGIGVANSMLTAGFLGSSAFARLNEDGTLTLITAVTDLGTGNHTALAQIGAQTLGIPFEQVQIAPQDSDFSPYDTGSIASRTVFDAGNAIAIACTDVRNQVADIASKHFECGPEDVVIQNGLVFDKNQPHITKTLAEIASEAIFLRRQGPILGRGAIMINPPHDHEIGEGFSERPGAAFSFGTHIVEVEVDPDTGQVKILNYTASHDVGQVINQAGIEGQVAGGVVQGVGYSLYEELVTRDGKILNPSFVDYRIPTAMDTAFGIQTGFVEIPEMTGPFGAKGVGEATMIPNAAAVANAILDAIGVQPNETPFTPERLYWFIRESNKEPVR